MEINPRQANSCTITDVSFLFWNRDRRDTSFSHHPTHTHDQQHNDDNPATNFKQQHIRHDTTRNTEQYRHHKHKHISISSTDTGPTASKWHGLWHEYLDKFFLCDASNSPNNEPLPRSTESQGIAYRERGPTERVNIVIVVEREREREREPFWLKRE